MCFPANFLIFTCIHSPYLYVTFGNSYHDVSDDHWSCWWSSSWPNHFELLYLCGIFCQNCHDHHDPCNCNDHHDHIIIFIVISVIIMFDKQIVNLELPKFSSARRWFSFAFASCSPFCSFTHSSISEKWPQWSWYKVAMIMINLRVMHTNNTCLDSIWGRSKALVSVRLSASTQGLSEQRKKQIK